MRYLKPTELCKDEIFNTGQFIEEQFQLPTVILAFFQILFLAIRVRNNTPSQRLTST